MTLAVVAIHRRPYWLVVGWFLFGGRGGASSQPLFVICACNHDLTGRRVEMGVMMVCVTV